MKEILRTIPRECFERSLFRSSIYLVISLFLTVGTGVFAFFFIPLTAWYIPAWIAYAFLCGTFATGCWVVAHECGHRAFCSNDRLQDSIGFVLHSLLLVPYFAWRRSHQLHHLKTNHLTDGETHVPPTTEGQEGRIWMRFRELIGGDAFALLRLSYYLLFGWPTYLLFGATGSPSRGRSNHFWPFAPFKTETFPRRTWGGLLLSNIGIGVVLFGLGYCCYAYGFMPVLALYVGPYLVVNAWLVAYTWLHHTDVDIPHLDESEWNFGHSVFLTVDRPYGRLLDFVHHRIGSTHVLHHVAPRIPHYHAAQATEALKEAFPELYRYDPTPIHVAMFRVASRCLMVDKAEYGWKFVETK